MVYSKSTLLAIVVSALTTTTLTANSYNGCAEINFSGLCTGCFERKVLKTGKGCGPLQPKNDTCLLYGYNGIKNTAGCSLCKTGFALKTVLNGTKVTQSCVTGTLKNCLLEVDVKVGRNDERGCLACPDNEYSVPNTTARTSTCQKIDKPVPNCKWGSVYSPQLGRAQCIRCNDGFAVEAKTRQCTATTEKGCWIKQLGKCVACDPFEGYSIDDKFKCFKTTNSVEFEGTEVIRKTFAALGLGF